MEHPRRKTRGYLQQRSIPENRTTNGSHKKKMVIFLEPYPESLRDKTSEKTNTILLKEENRTHVAVKERTEYRTKRFGRRIQQLLTTKRAKNKIQKD